MVEYENIQFDQDEALGGYDILEYEPPTCYQVTPKKRKRAVEDDDDVVAASGPSEPDTPKESRGPAKQKEGGTTASPKGKSKTKAPHNRWYES